MLRKRLDILLGFLTWIIALACRISLFKPLPGNPFDYGLFVFPAAWVLFLFLTLKLRQRSFGYYWWVYFSLPYVLSYWMLIIINPFWYTWGAPAWRLILPF